MDSSPTASASASGVRDVELEAGGEVDSELAHLMSQLRNLDNALSATSPGTNKGPLETTESPVATGKNDVAEAEADNSLEGHFTELMDEVQRLQDALLEQTNVATVSSVGEGVAQVTSQIVSRTEESNTDEGAKPISENITNASALKRSISFNTQAQVDMLVTEAGTLLERLSSTDALCVSDLLQDLSSSNLLAAILSAELGRDSMSGSCDSNLLAENAAALMARCSTSVASSVPDLLQDMSGRNAVAAALAAQLGSPEADGSTLNDSARDSIIEKQEVSSTVLVPNVPDAVTWLTPDGMSKAEQTQIISHEIVHNHASVKPHEGIKRYVDFIAEAKKRRKEFTQSHGPLENVLTTPGRSAAPESIPTKNDMTSPHGSETTPQEYQYFLRRHKEKRMKFKAMVSSVSLRTSESIEESAAESTADADVAHDVGHGDALGIDTSGEGESTPCCVLGQSPQNFDVLSNAEDPIPCSIASRRLPPTSESPSALTLEPQVEILTESTAALIARVSAADAASVPEVLQDMRKRNVVAAMLVDHAMETEVGARLTPSCNANSANMLRRQVSFNTQMQVDSLLEDAACLLTRLPSEDARGITEMLQELSNSNLLAGILAGGLANGKDGERLPTKSFAVAAVDSPMAEPGSPVAENVCMATAEAPQCLSTSRADVSATHSRTSSVDSDTFSEQLQYMMEDTAALIARLSALDADQVPDLLQDMSTRNAVAAALVDIAGRTEDALPDPCMGSNSRTRAGSLKRQISFNTKAEVETLVTEAGALLERLSSTDAQSISDLLQALSTDNMLAAILSAELSQEAATSGNNQRVSSLHGPEIELTMQKASEDTTLLQSESTERDNNNTEDAADPGEQLHLLLEHTGSLMARLNSTDIEDVPRLLEDMKNRNMLAAVMSGEVEFYGEPTLISEKSALKRCMSFNSQEQVDDLVSEASALMARLGADGNRDMTTMLQELSSSNVVAAMLSSELAAMPRLRSGSSHTSLAQQGGTLKMSSLVRSISFNTQADLDLLTEELGALMGRLASSDATEIAGVLQVMGDRNAVAGILHEQLKTQFFSMSNSRPSAGEGAHNLTRRLKIETREDIADLVIEAGTLLGMLAETDAAEVPCRLTDLSIKSSLAALLMDAAVDGIEAPAEGSPDGLSLSERDTTMNNLMRALKVEGSGGESTIHESSSSVVVADRNQEQAPGSFSDRHTIASTPSTSSLTQTLNAFRLHAAEVRKSISQTNLLSPGSSIEADPLPLKGVGSENISCADEIAAGAAVQVEMMTESPTAPASLDTGVNMNIPPAGISKPIDETIDLITPQGHYSPTHGPMIKTWIANLCSGSERPQSTLDLDAGDGAPILSHCGESPNCVGDAAISKDLALSYDHEYESEDDASDADGDELAHMLRTRKRDILVRGLKVMHLDILNRQSEFLFLWRLAITQDVSVPEPALESEQDISKGHSQAEVGIVLAVSASRPLMENPSLEPEIINQDAVGGCDLNRHPESSSQEAQLATIIVEVEAPPMEAVKRHTGDCFRDTVHASAATVTAFSGGATPASAEAGTNEWLSPPADALTHVAGEVSPLQIAMSESAEAATEQEGGSARDALSGTHAAHDYRGPGVPSSVAGNNIQEQQIVQVQALPQSLTTKWPDLDLESYHTNMHTNVLMSSPQHLDESSDMGR